MDEPCIHLAECVLDRNVCLCFMCACSAAYITLMSSCAVDGVHHKGQFRQRQCEIIRLKSHLVLKNNLTQWGFYSHQNK